MSKSLCYKATGSIGRDELNEVFDVLGMFSLSEATSVDQICVHVEHYARLKCIAGWYAIAHVSG